MSYCLECARMGKVVKTPCPYGLGHQLEITSRQLAEELAADARVRHTVSPVTNHQSLGKGGDTYVRQDRREPV